MFICVAKNFISVIAVEPQDWMENFSKTTRRVQKRSISISLDGGKKTRIGKWLYKPSLDALTGPKRNQAIKLYNAVVRGQDITIYMSGKNPITLDVPKTNDAFADFGAQCGIGRKTE